MNDGDKTKPQLIAELAELRQRLAEAGSELELDVPESSSRWHSLIANTSAYVLIVDRNHRFCFLNHPRAGETKDQVIGKTPYDYCLAEHHEAVREAIDWVFTTGEPASYEVQSSHSSVGNVWYQAQLGPIIESGKVAAVSMIAVDITARKLAEQERDRAFAILNAAVECLPFGCFAIDTDGRYMLANAVARSYYPGSLGKTPEEVCSNKDDLAMWLENSRRAFAGERVEGEVESTIHGENRQFYNVITPIRDGDQLFGILGVNVDITERVLAEKALRESEERYRLLVESIPHPVWRCDAEGRVTEFSRRWYEYTGQTPAEAAGFGWMAVLDQDDLRQVAQRMEKAMANGQFYETEFRLRRACDGSYRWHLSRALPMRNDDGEIVSWFGTAVDIHDQKGMQAELERRVEERTAELTAANGRLHREIQERRRAEKSLEQSHRELKMIYDEMVEGLLVTNVQTRRFVKTNASMCRMLGYSEGELLGASVEDIHPPEDVPNDLERFQAAAEGRVSINEDRPVLKKDGSVFYADITGHPIVFDGQRCLLALFRDVTERRELAEALRRSEERYRSVVEDQTEVISRFRADGTYAFVNEVYCRFFGKTRKELLGKKWHPVAHPDDLPTIESQLRTMSAANPIVVVENRVYSAQGDVRWMQFVNRGFFDRNGRLAEVQSVGRDITERKQAQEAVLREQRTLMHMLRASDHERQTIAYDIHDGLAQQLAAAIMHFQAYGHLKDCAADDAKASYLAGISMVQRAHAEARRLVSGVRPPALDEAGVAVALAHLVHEPREPGSPQIEYFDAVEFDRLPSILENAVYRIAQEAVANACRHSRSSKVKVSLVQEGDRLRLEVMDWGVGFDPNAVPDNHFGLQGIRERTRMLGGECHIRSELGQWTSVQVTLPIAGRQ